jgi:DNA polymerase alpha subunit A
VYEEFGQIAEKHKITEWMGKQVDRKYAFELPGVPQEASYLKVLYSFDRKYRRIAQEHRSR